MKRLLPALALACALAVAVAAPALSLRPYTPKPVDFELAPAEPAAVSSGGGFVSRPLAAPKRFNLVGARWRSRAAPRLWVRARRDGGRWTRWGRLATDADDGPDPGRREDSSGFSSPAWVGEADQVQYRLSRRVPGLRLHFVNVKGTASGADRLRTALRGAANTAVVSVGRVLGAHSARAQAQPAIVPRQQWGAASCPPRRGPEYGSVQAAYVHHTVSVNDYSPQEAPQIVLGICRYHRNSNGWNDIGYNFLVDKYGTIYEGRAGGIDRAVVGAQAQGYNAQTTGVANIGTFTSVPQSPAALQAMARLIRWKLPLHGVPTSGTTTLTSAGGNTNRYPSGSKVTVERVIGHRDTGSTECPGNALYAQLPELRRLVGSLGPLVPATALTARVVRRVVRYGRSAVVAGDLHGPDGAPLAGQRVEIQVLRKRRWVTVGATSTDSGGAFQARPVIRASRRIRARYAGSGGAQPAQTGGVLVTVSPLIGIAPPPRRGSTGARIRIRGRVKPPKRRLYLTLQLRRGRRYKTVGVRGVPVRRGRFAASFTPEGRGTYRFFLVTRPDTTTALGRSPYYLVPVR